MQSLGQDTVICFVLYPIHKFQESISKIELITYTSDS